MLRLLLADVQAKQEQLKEIEGQYRSQLARIVDFVVYRDGDVSNALSLMAEVQGKLDEVMQTAAHLGLIADKANLELEVLVLTKRVSEARSQLAELETRQKELSARLAYMSEGAPSKADVHDIQPSQREHIRTIDEEVTEVASEIERLNQLITEASERAALTIHVSTRKVADVARKRDAE
jgi:DNA repair exonuclease SbcCD ATPase subunit